MNGKEQQPKNPNEGAPEQGDAAVTVDIEAGATADLADQDVVDSAELSVEQLQQALVEANAAGEKHRDDCLRAQAELENMRKRSQRDIENAHKFGLERLVNELLPVKDSLELGLSAADGATEVASLVEGVDLTLKMFVTALEKLGIREVDPVGEKFNPEFHQAMTMQATSEAEPGTVMAVIQKGYLLNERLLRPALVTVASKPD